MSSPIVTDDDIEKEDSFFASEKKEKIDLESVVKGSVDKNDFIKADLLEETENELKDDIPSCYIPIDLVSNGRIEGIPKRLHFKCYSASDALDLNVDDDDKIKSIVKVLTRLNYEKFDVSLLTVQDVQYILYIMHNSFISPKITKKIYIDDTIEDKDELNSPKNIEEVDILINSLRYNYLGKNDDDEDLKEKIKVPFIIKDNVTKDAISFKFSVLKDIITAEAYCRNYYRNEFIKYGNVRSTLNKIKRIRDENEQDDTLNKYLIENEAKVNEYYDFMTEFSKMVVSVTQAETIVAFNGKPIEKLDEKWDIYNNKLSYDIWLKYNDVIEKFPFGIKDDVDVFIPSLNKTVHRRVGFQLDDFIHIDKHQDVDRYTVEFD